MQIANHQFSTENHHSKTVSYCRHLVQIPSITPNDLGCQRWISEKLIALGFSITWLNKHGVTNMLASYDSGKAGINFAFAGHTDVVPTGDEKFWLYPPFASQIRNNVLYGRGIADMKAGVACMLAALEDYFATSQVTGKVYFLLTSDEEGEAEFGTKIIKEYLDEQAIKIDYCLVGEPTSTRHIGDAIKVGRRGALSAELTCLGKQGHVAYPQFAENAIHNTGAVLQALNNINWDQGSDDFPGTDLQITYINSGQFTDNIIPSQCKICFNIRYSYQHNLTSLQTLIQQTLAPLNVRYHIDWQRPCEPYLTSPNEKNNSDFIALVESAIFEQTNSFPILSTSGGTSDGRFLSDENTQVIELGLKNQTIHQINEQAPLEDINKLHALYLKILEKTLS